MKKLISILILIIAGLGSAHAQFDADPYLNMTMNPSTLMLNSTGLLGVEAGNIGQSDIVANSLRVQITMANNGEITGLQLGGDPRWTVFSMTTGPGNTITLRNSGGTIPAFTATNFNLTVQAKSLGGPTTFTGNIAYYFQAGGNLLLPNPPFAPGTQSSAQGNSQTGNDNGQTSLTVTAIVPVRFNDLAAEGADCNTKLTWSTSTETGTSDFDVEYSPDGRNYIKVATIVSKGIAGGAAYEYAYPQGNGKGYYRIKMSNADGGYSYSKIVTSNITCNVKKVFLYPNPVSTNQILHVNVSNYAGAVRGEMSNEAGQIVLTQKLSNGSNVVPMMKLPQGTYHFKVFEGAKETQTFKVIVIQ